MSISLEDLFCPFCYEKVDSLANMKYDKITDNIFCVCEFCKREYYLPYTKPIIGA